MRFDGHFWSAAGAPRFLLILALLTAATLLMIETHLYATALVALIIGLVLTVTRSSGRSLAHNTERDAPKSSSAMDYLQSMLDTVNAALIVLDEDDRATLVNRSAQRLATAPIYRLAQIPLLGESAGRHLESVPAGRSDLVALADGQMVLASVSEFRAAGQPRQRLIALQRVASELEMVQLTAWRDVMRTLSHEMMNSLTPIASLAESLQQRLQQGRDGVASEVAAPAIEAIARRSRGLLQFIERYRDVANVPLARLESVDASAFARRLERLMLPIATERGIALACRTQGAAQELFFDPTLIEQATVNLLLNALDAVQQTSDPRVTFTIRADENETELAVVDNGTGVDPAHRSQLFVPFFTTKAHGSGIGLNLARNIALAHGGRLSHEPHAPSGSIFMLCIPRRDKKMG